MSSFYRFVQVVCFLFFRLLHRHKVYGAEHLYHNGGAMIAANHVSYYDPTILAASCPHELAFLAREPLFHFWGLSWLIRHLNAHPISGRSSDIGTLKLIGTLVKEGDFVVIFPEGERSWDGQLLPLNPGIAMIAMRYQCAIIPVHIHGAHEVWPRRRLLPKPWGKTSCTFGSPIFWQDYKELPKKEAQQQMTQELAHRLELLRAWVVAGAHGTPP